MSYGPRTVIERVRVKNDLELLRAASDTVRFGNARLCMYRDLLIPEQETQFAAMTFLLDDGSMFLAFRGTDNSLVGWKEDFNMTFQQTIPAQLMRVEEDGKHCADILAKVHNKDGKRIYFLFNTSRETAHTLTVTCTDTGLAQLQLPQWTAQPVKTEKMGDTVTFTDMDAKTYYYEVVALDVLGPYDVEEMTSGAFDLTLFTCTYGGQNRVTVYCDRFSGE